MDKEKDKCLKELLGGFDDERNVDKGQKNPESSDAISECTSELDDDSSTLDNNYDLDSAVERSMMTTPPKKIPIINLTFGCHAKKHKGTGFFNHKDGVNDSKKCKLPPLDYKEERRRHIKNIIDRLPKQRDVLFNYKLDRSEINKSLVERKIRPWIHRKIVEYIGEPEPTLEEFICLKILAGGSPQSILDDVQLVLDEEAEVFVVKLWRLLIYEVEAKKLGLNEEYIIV